MVKQLGRNKPRATTIRLDFLSTVGWWVLDNKHHKENSKEDRTTDRYAALCKDGVCEIFDADKRKRLTLVLSTKPFRHCVVWHFSWTNIILFRSPRTQTWTSVIPLIHLTNFVKREFGCKGYAGFEQ